jgi:hypothetical protein
MYFAVEKKKEKKKKKRKIYNKITPNWQRFYTMNLLYLINKKTHFSK